MKAKRDFPGECFIRYAHQVFGIFQEMQELGTLHKCNILGDELLGAQLDVHDFTLFLDCKVLRYLIVTYMPNKYIRGVCMQAALLAPQDSS